MKKFVAPPTEQKGLFHEDAPDEDLVEKKGPAPPIDSFRDRVDAHLAAKKEAADKSAREALLVFRVRVHPFRDVHEKYEKRLLDEELAPYLAKLQVMVKKPGVTILIEREGVVHSYRECNGRTWTETMEMTS